MGSLGELERSVMDVLWTHPAGLSAAQLRSLLSDRDLALTTVHTVLARLEKKGFALRDRSVRPHLYTAATSREEHVAELMGEVLATAPDRHAVLARFIGAATEDDTAFLTELLATSR